MLFWLLGVFGCFLDYFITDHIVWFANKIKPNFSILRLVSEYKDELFPDALDSDYDKGCLAGLQGSVLDISVKEDNPNYDAPVVSDNDTDASSAGSETESEDSEFISCPL